MPSIISYVSSFFARHLRREVKELYFSVAIMEFAVAMVSLFEPIYLWKIGFKIPQILLFYLAVYGLYFFILPLGAKIARGYGFEHGILFSSPFLILYFLSLFATPYSPAFVGVAVIAFAIQKTLYWPSYHADFTVYSDDGERGKELGNLMLILSMVAMAGPFIGGTLIYFFGFPTLFIIACAAILASNIPLFSTLENFSPKKFSYKGAYKRLIAPENRRAFFAYLGYGEELIFMYVWPVFIFLIMKNELSAGSLVAAATLLMIVITLYIGKLSDNKNKSSVIKAGAAVSIFSWIARIFPLAAVSLFFVESLTRVGRNFTQVPIFALTYDRAKRSGNIMERIIFFEMSLIAGKIITCGILIGLFYILPTDFFWKAVFVLAGGITLLYGLL